MAELEAEGVVAPGRRSPGPRRGRWLLLAALAAVALGAVIVVLALSSGLEGTRHMAKPSRTTGMGFHRGGAPPPWESGNGVWVMTRANLARREVGSWARQYLGGSTGEKLERWLEADWEEWRVANMHAGNLDEIMRREGMAWVEVELVGDGECLVVDPRVPREWFYTYPRHDWLELAGLRLGYPDKFSTHPSVERFSGSEWELVERSDPDGLLARFLPGSGIRFEDIQVSCSDDRGVEVARRFCMLEAPRPGVFWVLELYGYSYSGITGDIEVAGDRLIFTVGGPVSGVVSSRVGVGGALHRKAARVEYRRVDGTQAQSDGL